MNAAGFGSAAQTVLPQEIVTAVEDCGFFESIPLWAVTLIGGLFITILSFIMIMSVYGRFFRLYLYTAIAPVSYTHLDVYKRQDLQAMVDVMEYATNKDKTEQRYFVTGVNCDPKFRKRIC